MRPGVFREARFARADERRKDGFKTDRNHDYQTERKRKILAAKSMKGKHHLQSARGLSIPIWKTA